MSLVRRYISVRCDHSQYVCQICIPEGWRFFICVSSHMAIIPKVYSVYQFRHSSMCTPKIYSLCSLFLGAPSRVRTYDLLLKREQLYQLSYGRDSYKPITNKPTFSMCRGWESNPHEDFMPLRILSPVRLPIPSPRHFSIVQPGGHGGIRTLA